jgi:hypothetical protein
LKKILHIKKLINVGGQYMPMKGSESAKSRKNLHLPIIKNTVKYAAPPNEAVCRDRHRSTTATSLVFVVWRQG